MVAPFRSQGPRQSEDAGVAPHRSFLIYAASYVAAGATPFLLLPVLTRHLSPDQFGEITAFLVLTGLLANTGGLSAHGFLASRYFKVDARQLTEMVWTSLVVLVVTHVAALAAVALAFPYIGELLGLPFRYALLAALAAFLLNLNLVFLAIFQFSGRPWHYLRMRLAQAVMELALCIGLLFLVAADASARVWSYTAAVALTASGGFVYCVRSGLVFPRWNRGAARSLLRFGIPLLPHVAAGMAITYTDRLLVSSLLGTATLGVYMVATQIGMVMVALIEPLNKALAPWLFRHLASDQHAVRRMIVRRTYEICGALVLSGVLLAVAADALFDRLIGREFAAARGLVPWMIAGYVAQGMYYLVVNYLFYAERTATLAAITASAAVLGFLFSYLLIGTLGVTGAGAAFVLNNVVLMLLVWLGASRIVPMPWANWRRYDVS